MRPSAASGRGRAVAPRCTGVRRFQPRCRCPDVARCAATLPRQIAVASLDRTRELLTLPRIAIEDDRAVAATHGAQQLTFFNGYYDSWCYLPLLAFVTFDDEAEQYLAAAVLRPGNVPATQGAVGVLRRLLALLRLAFPQARFLVRLDGGFATPEIFDVMAAARVQSEESGETEHGYTDVGYAARRRTTPASS